ncbi:MAG: hypothetical protein C7B44_00060 [Sulfobacillus thermosulfidooxidans]|nr:MAG: hypothetical protein C7B44_00060 [Sulfobacillus thermosulfidooxidans]
MRLWRNWYIGNPKRAMTPFQAHIALAFNKTRIVWSTFGSAPLWIEGRLFWQQEEVTWTRLQEGSHIWWCGQNGQTVVIVGRGPRPALVLNQDAWTGIVPAGRGSTMGILPSDTLCTAKFTAPNLVHHQQVAR